LATPVNERAANYSACIFERGPHEVAKVGDDPVFRGVPEAFQIMESHCGQIEWPPAGWSLVATAGRRHAHENAMPAPRRSPHLRRAIPH
jgi:hypothetical protein